MKIIKYQGGGLSLPQSYIDYSLAWLLYLAETQTDQANKSLTGYSNGASRFQSDEKGAVGIFTKSMTDDVMEKVLPVDGRELIDMSIRFDDFINPYNPASSTAVYSGILQKLLQAKYEKEIYIKAVDNARSKGALQGPAISADNTVWVKLGNRIGKKKIENVKSTDRLLTVAELAQLRAYNPKFAGDETTIIAIENATSMKNIQDTINNILNSIPTSGVKYTIFGTREQLIAKGYEEVMKTSIDGVYKLTIHEQSNKRAVDALLKYLYDTLDDNLRAYLTVVAKKANLKAVDVDKNPIDPVQVLLMEFVQGKYQFNNDYEASFESDASKALLGEDLTSKKGGSQKDLTDVKSNASIDFLLLMGEKKGVQIKIGRVLYLGIGTKGTLVDREGKALGGMTLLTSVDNSEMAFGMDTSQMHFGSARVSDTDKNKIVVDGGSLINIALPVDLQALSVGEIRPDFKMFLQATKALKEAQGLKDIRQINLIYRKYGLPAVYKLGANGEPELQANYRQFAVLHGYADRSALRKSKLGDDIDLNVTIQKVQDSDDADSIVKIIKSFNETYKPTKDFPIPHPWRGDDLYEGSIFIPIYENPLSYLGSTEHTVGNAIKLTEALHYLERATTLSQQYRKTPKLNY